MISLNSRPIVLLTFIALAPAALMLQAQAPAKQNEQLRFVVYLSRHGVRSPTGDPGRYDSYSALPWPKWEVPPGYLTPHGYQLMKLFGAYDREWLAGKGLFAPSGCANVGQVAILADSDQRTRETGQALAEGMFPGCGVEIHALPEGSHDPLFHPIPAGAAQTDPVLETAAIRGRIGGDPNNLTTAYRSQLDALQRVLSDCGHAPAEARKPAALLEIPSSLESGSQKHPAELRGPLLTASSLTENLLLEYSDGRSSADVGWGCVDGTMLRSLMQLHSAAEDLKDRTPAVARRGASDLLDHILMAMEQQVTGNPEAGAPGKPGDRLLILVGHDTNVANVAGLLHLDWILDGRRDDTPPGGALVFELWQDSSTDAWSVRVDYTAQTLEQMRGAQALTLDHPPDRVPVFVPDCGRQDMSCTWPGFSSTVRHALQP